MPVSDEGSNLFKMLEKGKLCLVMESHYFALSYAELVSTFVILAQFSQVDLPGISYSSIFNNFYIPLHSHSQTVLISFVLSYFVQIFSF